MTFADNILRFYRSLKLPARLPKGVGVMNPYHEDVAFDLCQKFYSRFYGDSNERFIILGINPGRFGGGITGVPFTDPIRLQTICGIENDLKKKAELSSEFVYTMIDAAGGPEKFYGRFYISAMSPLGFVKDGKNLNYYDIPDLQKAVEPFMIDSIQRQLDFGVRRDRCYCLGEGKNFQYLSALNKKHEFFGEIIPLAHPRFIMQYKRKQVPSYIAGYLEKMEMAKT